MKLYVAEFATTLGNMIAISSEKELYLLEFESRKNLQTNIESLKKQFNCDLIYASSEPILKIQDELSAYFQNKLNKFTTPIAFSGTEFQKQVWEKLREIPHGQTISYKQLALNINSPKSFRAVARANSCNKIAIVVPCHRVINSNGKLGGYSGGLDKKQGLLKLEQNS